MAESRISTRYALSLFGLAQEQGQLEAIKDDVEKIQGILRQNRDLQLMLQSPVVNPAKKWNTLERIFGGELKELTLKFLEVILRKRREGLVTDIVREFMLMYREHKNILTATLTTAVPVSNSVEKHVRQYLERETGAEVVLETKTDRSLLGGFVLKYKDKLVDASVATELKDLRRHLITSN